MPQAPCPPSLRVTADRLRTAAVAVAVLLIAAACSSTPAAAPAPDVITDKGTPYADLLVPKLQASVTDGAIGVPVDSPVTVTAGDGVLGQVSLTNEAGVVVDGQLSPDGTSWSSAEPLGYNKQYTLQAEALGLGGVTSTSATFETHSPDNLTMPYVAPNDGETVGVGQPITIRFDENITNRLAAQQAVTVTTDPPVEGAFYWLNNREVRWRPAQYWKPGTTVEVEVKAYGVEFGDGLFGQDDASTRFTIGDEVIATADDATKMLTVRRNGEVVKTMPISMGKAKTPTDNGTYIIGDRYSFLVMDSSTYGVPVNSPDGYRTEVEWATQMSYSGIYVHSAPWSVGSQGVANVSHGCLNVSPANARWFYDNTRRGDIVEVVNTTGPTLSGTDGLGDWNIPWDRWKAGNAND
ncbi:L,D-transpeptidase [Mycolicibacterium vanbaalenii]|uniref:ErfK/YbiS/YcfS/YnhG family protein n=1 Tax=Mycolicibacterium vanbaalenii (strain DSM 7251 / JCM 13017 / BCRC 16820 / KCTC 9966 / NRRL B-24157 / PYR-1) TaxID=350058 RepID=A1THG9_MYCVP|nr:Ig-like domain-containing protein [Mycolicibacterium vanbaalenii]ABM16619.1 ErfK/YbiS/YcfS/YnhG family protein [Mycolicibacterium vanbaalenii PYR-1]MCV7131093.1 L,D-transpeptidase [Mycolicibacterium vanbaalenii PYR-1]